jgi:hypothetical protein
MREKRRRERKSERVSERKERKRGKERERERERERETNINNGEYVSENSVAYPRKNQQTQRTI